LEKADGGRQKRKQRVRAAINGEWERAEKEERVVLEEPQKSKTGRGKLGGNE